MSLFGSSGIRRVADQELLYLSVKVGLSLGRKYKSVVIGSDTRSSSESVKFALVSGLLAGGCRAYDAGIIPTPTLAFAARDFNAGIMVTASHNPPEYNGLKLWNPDGSAFDITQRNQIDEDIQNNSLTTSVWEKMQQVKYYKEAIEKHMSYILEYFSRSLLDLKVVVDCNCGAASLITPRLLTEMGCEVIAINSYNSSFFPHKIEPVAENLTGLAEIVQASHASLGIAHDGDADRMVAIDRKGRYVPGDKLLAIFARNIKPGKLVTTIDTSMALDELNCKIVRTKVGDAFVSEELKKDGQFGGEPAGSWIFPEISYCPDGIYAAAQLAQICRDYDLTELVDALPSYPIMRGSIENVSISLEEQERKLRTLNPLLVDKTDGIKLIFKDGWLLIRPSGTEPKVRLTVETKNLTSTEMLYNTAVRMLTEDK